MATATRRQYKNADIVTVGGGRINIADKNRELIKEYEMPASVRNFISCFDGGKHYGVNPFSFELLE